MRRLAFLPLLALTALAAGCGSGKVTPTTTAAPKTPAGPLRVSLTNSGCAPAKLSARSGALTFRIDGSSAKVTELELKTQNGIILAEREHIQSGQSGSFSLRLGPGQYVLSCPSDTQSDNGKLFVTGAEIGASPVDAKLLDAATTAYKAFVQKQADELLAGTKQFVAALRAGNLTRAKNLFGPTRFHYEDIEPVAESFGDLDPKIDARVNDVASPSQWTGFHRIEQILWVKGTTAGTARYGTELLNDVATLDYRVATLTFQPAQLANGAVELLNEVANSKITGEEDRYSHTDLSDFEANVAGAQKAYELLRPALIQRRNIGLVETLDERFADVANGLARYRRPTPLGYAFYGALTPADRLTLAQDVDALAEALSGVAAKVSQ